VLVVDLSLEDTDAASEVVYQLSRSPLYTGKGDIAALVGGFTTLFHQLTDGLVNDPPTSTMLEIDGATVEVVSV
jgi:hypothetical protein